MLWTGHLDPCPSSLPPSLPCQVVDIAGQRGCLILDLAEDKKGQLKSLPGLLLGGEKGGCQCCRHEVCLRRSTDAVRQPARLLWGRSKREKEAGCSGTCRGTACRSHRNCC